MNTRETASRTVGRLRIWLSIALGALPLLTTDRGEAAGPVAAPLARQASLQARIAAEPHRIKEILQDHGTDWCGISEQTRQRNPRRLLAAGSCPVEGPADLPANRNACIPNANTPFKVVRLKFNVFRRDDGSAAAATQAQVDAQVQTLNASYAPARIRFIHTTEYINSTQFRSLAYYVNSEEAEMKTRHADSPESQHNIYVVDIEPDPDSGGSLLGVSTFPWDPDAVRAGGGTILDDDSIGAGQQTLVHELGHALGLWHTHHGVREVQQCSACWETADGARADTTGDLCSDTPPTPVNYKCQPPGGSDPCSGRAWGPTAPQNYMGYAPDSCYSEFTPQQAGRMHCWIQDRLQGLLASEQEITVNLSATDASASETGPDAATFSVTRTGSTALPLTVNFTRAGTASQGADYLAIGNSIALPAGSASATIRVTPVNDSESEPTETVILNLADGAGYQLGTARTATASITDNDPPAGPVVTLVATDATAAEAGANPAVFTVTRTGSTAAPLTVNYTVGGTTVPADYTPALSGSLTIPAGSASATLTLTPVNDTSPEPEETLVLQIGPGAGYTPGNPAAATATLADDDTTIPTTILAENFDRLTPPALPAGWSALATVGGSPWQTLRLNDVTLSNIVYASSVEAVSDSVLVSPPLAIPAAGARLSFLHGLNLEQEFDGGIREIAIANGPFVDIVDAGGVFEADGYNGTISPTDGSPIAGRAAWTGETAGNLQTVVRFPAAAAGQTVRLRWRLACDAAVITGGWGIDLVEVTPLGGGAPTLVSVSASDPDAAEAGANPGTFTLTRTGSTAAALAVNITLDGTATAGADYPVIASPVTIPAGSASVTVTVSPVNDTAPEAPETVTLTAATGPGYAVGSPAAATITIQDDDTPTSGVVFAENFDGVTPPNLPSGWTTTFQGAGAPWRAVAYTDLSPPNSAYAPNPEFDSDNALVSPPIVIATAEARLRFQHGYILEEGYDGGVLEVSIGGAPFADILAAGGRFVSGGYDGPLSTTDGSAIAGRNAWTGDSIAYRDTEVQLPASAAGQTLRLRWRLVTDGGIGGDGWVVDNIAISEAGAGSSLPLVTITATDPTAAEYGPDTGEFTISRTGATTSPLTVPFAVSGTASAGADYPALGASVVIPAGSATVSLSVAPVADASLETTETVQVALQAAAAYQLGSASSATVRLLDNSPSGSVVFGANFDELTPPNLPTGWAAILQGTGNPWTSIADSQSSVPNRLFAPDPDNVSDNLLTTPPIAITTASAQLVFVHEYQLEPGYDGAILEIALSPDAAAPFQEILAAGGTFVTGGYDGPLSLNDGSPIAGRNAWTGSSDGPRVTRVTLPAAAAGRSIRLRWRCTSDGGVPDAGYALDSVAVAELVGGGNADLAVTLRGPAGPATTDTPLAYTVTVTNRSPVVARGVVLSNLFPATLQLQGATSSQGTVAGTGPVVALLGQLNGGASATLILTLSTPTAATVTVSATATGADPDPVPANNAATATTTVLPDTTPVSRYTNTTAVAVSDSVGPGAPYPSTLTVAGFEGSIGALSVTLHGLSHTFPDDLDILLVGPGGQKVLLMSDAGGDERFALTYTTLTFNDDAADPIPDRSQVVAGSYRPADYEAGEALPAPAPAGPFGTSLAAFRGLSPNGTWQLFVADDSSKDSGRLAAGWSLAITRAAANVTPPVITTQPAGRIVAAGSPVALGVVATGTAPLTYQWRFGGADLPGANQPTLNLPAVTAAQSGDYAVRVANDAGAVVSQAASLVVTTQARQLRLGSLQAAAGSSVSIPVALAAQGDENRTRFSVGFDVERLRFSSVTVGDGAPGATLTLNVNQLESGRVGVQLSLPPNGTFPNGQRQIALLQFETLAGAAGATSLSFLDAPAAREIAGTGGQSLPADYLPGTLTFGAEGPTLGALALTSTGGLAIRFTVSGQPGRSVRIEASPDLRTWNPVTTLPNPSGSVTFSEAVATATPSHFYRAVQLP